ncbi:MAG: M48 family metallopeptidase [Hymenobacteraceae bacterium]|nr:M48 family metallopeptidase [Hymenobacteraceae bacterium]MDX5394999.1 M48 family metallopeptidase [Hymenobacteraceae bacterium]MDX5442454.1 M48 family metallopeptidase [Hymenobacteraceae bacterium]MDX5511032.1 M48 family metallopeptidase [Hymenobacteraceae bacterium]
MLKRFFQASLIALMVGCSTVPITGRRQLDLVPDSQMLALSFDQYSQFLREHKLSNNAQATSMVKNVGQRIQRAVEQYMAQNNMSDQLNGYQWEFNLIESEEVNAWAMPGGKVVVYEGLLPVVKDETGLAVVMGHEIAHAIAKHGNERMSQGLVQQFGGAALSVALRNQPQATQNLFLTSYGVGSGLGMLKYSRTQESEADRLGLIFMAMAGYNPQQAIPFWERMAAKKDGQGAPPEFLSTHPSDATRINDLQKHMPEAMRYYKRN